MSLEKAIEANTQVLQEVVLLLNRLVAPRLATTDGAFKSQAEMQPDVSENLKSDELLEEPFENVESVSEVTEVEQPGELSEWPFENVESVSEATEATEATDETDETENLEVVSYEAVRERLMDLVQAKGTDVVRSVLQKFGNKDNPKKSAAKLPEISSDDLPKLYFMLGRAFEDKSNG